MSIRGNLPSEQLLHDGSIILGIDQPIRGKRKIEKVLKTYLGSQNVSLKKIGSDTLHVFKKSDGTEVILLCAAITYMGGNGKNTLHPAYLNRIQLPKVWKQIVEKWSSKYEIKFIGIYQYEDLVVFTDVLKDTYINRKMNNSSVHIYMNDLYNAHIHGVFKRIDRNNNILISISPNNFKNYLDDSEINTSNDFSFFKKFNSTFINDDWIIAIDSIKHMRKNNFKHWKQGEWPGWSLEYRFNEFIEANNIKNVEYAGNPKTKIFEYDFDVWMNDNMHYADLKSSDQSSREVIGNDRESVLNAIKDYGSLWYIVYEHDTNKDSDYEYEQTRERSYYIREEGEWGTNVFNELSYKNRMKHSIKYTRMFILELSEHNYKHYLSIFKQGKQPDGSARKSKIKFSKHQIENAIIYSENLTKEPDLD